MKKFLVDGNNLSIEIAKEIVDKGIQIGISEKAKRDVKRSREVVEKWIREDKVIYGVTTGFGEFKDIRIPLKDLQKLQENLLISHSAGVGVCLPKNIIRLMLLLRINSLAKGYSGVRLELIEFLVRMFNQQIIPHVPSQGSVGSSGDLAPLAHLASFIIGEGYAYYKNELYESKSLLRKLGWKSFKLEAKEGLALVNGTQMMTAYAVEIISGAERLSKLADVSGAMSVEALRGSDYPFKDELQRVRPHPGQIKAAANLRKLLKDSEIRKSHIDCDKVQDAYSLRCIPQVHGAVKDTIEFVKRTVEIEINSATDNPLIFGGEGHGIASSLRSSQIKRPQIIQGGNFHGEPVALAMDYLKIAISELGNISERRTARLVDGSLSGLPRSLTEKGGLNSGLMMAQYTAAALVSENKILSHPATVDSIPTSANQEDHNSMGSIAARKCFEVLNNVEKVIAIEFLCAAQGIDFLKPLKCGVGTGEAHAKLRKKVKHIEEDVNISNYIESTADVIYDEGFLGAVERKTGRLS